MHFVIESNTKFNLRSEGGVVDDYTISVDGNSYVLKRIDYGNEHPGDNKIVVEYTDENNWTLLDQNTSIKCENRPKVISTYIERKGSVWSGKTMNYTVNNEDDDCTTTPIDGDFFNYTQFIGDNSSTTASGYRAFPLAFIDFSTIEDYDIGGETPVNPICIEEAKTIIVNSTCNSSNLDIKTPNYLDDSFWITPTDLSKIWVTFP